MLAVSFIKMSSALDHVPYLQIMLLGLIIALVIYLAFAITRYRKMSVRDNAIITSLSDEYDGILYVRDLGESNEQVEMYRDRKSVTKQVLGWEVEKSFKKKMDLLAEYLCHPGDREEFLRLSSRENILSRLEDQPKYFFPFRVVIDSETHYYKMVFVAQKDPEGIIQGITVGFLCTDELVKMEESNLQALEDARRANKASKMKTLFVQNISHDIRTPLNAIVGYSQLLGMPEMYLSDDEKAEFSEYISNSAELLSMLVDDVLELADIENNVVKVEFKDTACNEICNKAIHCSKMRVQRGVDMYFTSELPDDYIINTDPRRVQQILINFLSNACKHTMKGEIHVHASLSENPGFVTLSVADTGDGVPEDMADNIFERFASADRLIGGHGLGLNICHDLATRLGGDVRLDNTYKNGARFLLLIPVK